MDRARLFGRHPRGVAGRVALAVLLVVGILLLLGLPDSAAQAPQQPPQTGGLTPEELDKLWPPEEGRPGWEPQAPSANEPPPAKPADTRSMAQREADARKQQKEALQRIQQLLKQPVAVAPPPSLSLECETDEVTRMLTSQLVQQYVRQASEPEAGLLKQLTSARRELQLLGADAREGLGLETQVADRLVAKAQLLMKTTSKQRDKVLAVMGFTLRVGQMAALLDDGAREQQLMSALAAWLAELVPAIVKDIRGKHDYGLVSALIELTRAANLSGLESGNVDIDKVFREIEAAMSFDLTLTFELRSVGANGSTEEWTLRSEFPVKYTLGGGRQGARDMLAGSGTGSYTRYVDLDPGDSKIRMTAPSFPVQAKIEPFDACKGRGQVVVDVFYAETETYIFKSGPNAPLPMVRSAWTILFEENRRDGAYAFDVAVTNLDATAIDSALAKAMGVFTGTLKVKLLHKPR